MLTLEVNGSLYESNNIFSMIYTNIWSLLLVNSRLIFTSSSPMDWHKPLILTHSSYMVSPPQMLFFQITYQHHVHQLYMALQYQNNIQNWHVSTVIPSLNSSHVIREIRETSIAQVKFLHIYFFGGGGY